MIAEIYKKMTTGEDQLTGNFFGSLRYLPFYCGMKVMLQKSVFPSNLLDCIENVQLNEWDKNIYFWNDCSYDRTEPDVIIELEDIVILFEVKLDSGLGEKQLEREADLLLKQYHHCKNKFLILLAKESYAVGIYEEYKAVIPKGVCLGYITWQKALTALNSINTAEPFRKLVLSDLSNLLRRKGFESFKGFEMLFTFDVFTKDCWKFNPDFCFESNEIIKERLYYEFK